MPRTYLGVQGLEIGTFPLGPIHTKYISNHIYSLNEACTLHGYMKIIQLQIRFVSAQSLLPSEELSYLFEIRVLPSQWRCDLHRKYL